MEGVTICHYKKGNSIISIFGFDSKILIALPGQNETVL